MASAIKLVKELVSRGIYLYVEGAELKFRSKKGALTKELKSLVVENKEAIIKCLLDLEQSELSSDGAHAPKLQIRDSSQSIPLSFAQQRLWFIDRLEEGSSQYNMCGSFVLNGLFNHLSFTKALQAIMERHEVLRTIYQERDGIAYQVIKEDYEVSYVTHDLINHEEGIKLRALEDIKFNESQISFSLDRDLLLRVIVVKLTHEIQVVVYTMHHIASDGWSLNIFQKEFYLLYKAFSLNQDNPLKPLKYQYADYAVWQRSWLKGEVLNRQLSYWKNQLDGLPAVHNFPLDNPRPARQTFSGKVFQSRLKSDSSKKLRSICEELEVTSFVFLETVFAVLLSRFSNENDIVIGSPTAGRNLRELEASIGFFVNTLILRTDLSGNPSFLELLHRNKQVILDAQNNQNLPFEKIVEELSPERHLSYSSLVQISFGLQKSETEFSEEQLSYIESQEELSSLSNEKTLKIPFELKLDVYEAGDSTTLAWIYNYKIFSSSTIERLANSYSVLLENIISCLQTPSLINTPVGELGILNEKLKYRMLNNQNSRISNSKNGEFVHNLFDVQVRLHPDSIALIHGKNRLNYLQLDQRSNQLAQLLLKRGVSADSKIAIYIDRSIDMVVSLLAILKSGAAYVPVDPGYPDSRLEYILNDCKPQIIVTSSKYKSQFDQRHSNVLCLDDSDIQQELNAMPDTYDFLKNSYLSPDNLAYIIYTSGSTGQPKGVQISHRSACDFLTEAVNNFVSDDISGAVVSSPLAFDATIGSLLVPLCAGIYADLLPGGIESLEELGVRLFNDNHSYLFKITPSHLEAVFALDSIQKNANAKHVIVVAGEVLLSNSLKIWANINLPNSHFINEYGPTETTVGCTIYPVARPYNDSSMFSVPIGRPLGCTALYVLNENLSPQNMGCVGELYVGGIGLARGYLNRASLTALKFVPNVFSQVIGERLYRTGDLVRYLEDGNLEFIGRIDNQVKIRGFRIELGEIEAQLFNQTAIKEAAVLAVESDGLGKYLVAYIVFEKEYLQQLKKESSKGIESYNKNEMIEDVKARLSAVLPVFMVPEKYIILEQMPLNSNGKLDRKCLPEPNHSDSLSQCYVEPTGEVEKKLCDIWSELLKHEKVSVNDNFFALGGHSILATRLTSAVREAFQIDIPLRVVFEFPTVKGMSEFVQNASNQSMLPKINRIDRKEMLPLSFAQQRLWFVDQLGEGSVQYNMPGQFFVQGDIDINAFKLAIASLLERHEVLRTTINMIDNQVQQIILDEYELPFSQYNLCQLDDENKEKEVHKIISQESKEAFDLSQDLMLRVVLISLTKDYHLIYYTMHHIASDGWSRGILQYEISVLYNAFLEGKENPLTPLAIQYADFSAWQRQWLQEEKFKGALGYWKMQLENLPSIHSIPTDKARPIKQRFIGKSQVVNFDKSLTTKIRQFNQLHGTTLFMFMHAAFAVLIARYSGERDIVVGSAISGRSHSELQGLIGLFLNDLVLRGDLSGNPSFTNVIKSYRKLVLEAFEYQQVPFEMLVEELKPVRSMSHSPLFQVKLDVQNNEQKDLNLSNLELIDIRNNVNFRNENEANKTEHSVKHDLYVNVTEGEDRLTFYWLYNTDLFFDDTIHRMTEQFSVLLDNILEAPDKNILSLDLLTRSQQKALLMDWSGKSTYADQNSGVHKLFEAQVEDNLNEVAVIYRDECLTYKELNEQVNQLAHYLRSKGLKANTLVALCLERSLDMLVGMLAVLKLRAAYVPIDPGYPQGRIEYMLNDCNCSWVLTQSDILADLALGNVRLLPIDGEIRQKLMSSYSNENISFPNEGFSANSLAYVIYTSGSTGQPKGVMVEHDGLIKYAEYALSHYYLEHLNGSLVATSYSFDLTAPSLYLPLLSGGFVELLPEDDKLDGLASKIINSSSSYLLRLTPSHIMGMLPLMSHAKNKCRHVFVIGGEPLAVTTVSKLKEIFPFSKIYNHYGPTESVIGCSIFHISSIDEIADLIFCPIGRAMSNQQLLVLNDDYRLNPVGVPGELFVGGTGLARGYLNQPKLTAERFIENPFSSKKSERLYRTGDLARWLPDGNLEFIRRIDQQVKIHGLRIEMGEIEQGLLAIENIRDCAVIVCDSLQSGKSLVAYIVLEQHLPEQVEDEADLIRQKSALVQSIRQSLVTHLPEYMIPNIYIFLKSLPLNRNGKLNLEALPQPEESDLIKSRYVAPRNDLEKQLSRIWQNVLNIEQLGIEDDFFLLGGHSLIATRLVNLIRQEFEIELPLRALFENSTISSLSDIVALKVYEKNAVKNEKEILEADDIEEVEFD